MCCFRYLLVVGCNRHPCLEILTFDSVSLSRNCEAAIQLSHCMYGDISLHICLFMLAYFDLKGARCQS